MKKSIIIYLLLLGTIPFGIFLNTSCIEDPGPVGPTPNGELTTFIVGQGSFCLEPFELKNNWKMDVNVDVLSGPFWNNTFNFTGTDNNNTGFDIVVPTSGMYTITVEIYPTPGTSCAECCSSICFPIQKGKPEFRGMQTFSAPTFFHTVTINLEDCDCC